MSELIFFTVLGTPAPQGSKTPWGSEANPRTRPWRAAVAAEAALAMNKRTLFTGPVAVECCFYFARPKHHFRSGRYAHLLKPGAPRYCERKPDSDKLARAVGDSLSGVVVRDDAQIAVWTVWKLWGEPARCDILVRCLVPRQEKGQECQTA